MVCLDPEALKSLASMQQPNKPNLLVRIVELYKSESPQYINEIEVGLDTTDMTAVQHGAHTLKSSSAIVGAVALADCCRKLELAAHEDNHKACIVLGAGIDELFAQSCAAIDLYMAMAA